MTLRGGICLAADGILLILALGSGIRALHILAIFLTVFCLFSLLSLVLAVATLRVESGIRPAELKRGETVQYRFAMEGRVVLPVVGHLSMLPPGVRGTHASQRHRHAFFLRPSLHRWQRAYPLNMPCAHRGYWPIGPESLRLQDIFGLFSLPIVRGGQVQPVPATLGVLPLVRSLQGRDDSRAVMDGFAAAMIRNAQNGELFGDTRQYRDGDPMKRVHWKQSARTGKLHIRQFEAQENPQVLVVLDLCCVEEDTVSRGDVMTEIVASLAWHTVSQGKTLQVCPMRPAEEHPGEGESHWVQSEADFEQLLYRLTEVHFHTQEAVLGSWQLQEMRYLYAGTVYIVTDQPSSDLLAMIQKLRKEGRRMCCILPGEQELPAALAKYRGRDWFMQVPTPEDITEKVGACL